jgi:glycerol-3-phosphate responsive antiterminator
MRELIEQIEKHFTIVETRTTESGAYVITINEKMLSKSDTDNIFAINKLFIIGTNFQTNQITLNLYEK